MLVSVDYLEEIRGYLDRCGDDSRQDYHQTAVAAVDHLYEHALDLVEWAAVDPDATSALNLHLTGAMEDHLLLALLADGDEVVHLAVGYCEISDVVGVFPGDELQLVVNVLLEIDNLSLGGSDEYQRGNHRFVGDRFSTAEGAHGRPPRHEMRESALGGEHLHRPALAFISPHHVPQHLVDGVPGCHCRKKGIDSEADITAVHPDTHISLYHNKLYTAATIIAIH